MLKYYTRLFKEAARATLAAKSRTFLSAVCIGLGIASITLVAALGTAAVSKTNELMDMFGTDAVMIFSGSKKKMAAGAREMTLTVDDVEDLRANFPDAYLVAPLRMRPGMRVSYQNANLSTELQAVTAGAEYEWNWNIAMGRDLSAEDNYHSSNVCIVRAYVNKMLFDGSDPLGAQIKVGKFTCEVVGVLENKSIGAMDDEFNNFIMIPDSVFAKKYSWRKTHLIALRMSFYDPQTIDGQMENVREFLRYRHGLHENEEDDFQIFTPSALSATIYAVLGAIGAFLGVITLVIMMVGGFVTANMFLLATQSRIKEIGIRRAFGATGGDIFRQFIAEFILIIFCGMLTGLGIAAGASAFISSFGFLQVGITPGVFAFTAFISMAVAVTFGILPARSASRINPIEAIRTL